MAYAANNGMVESYYLYGNALAADKKIKEAVMSAIYKAAGLDTNGHGITFSVPVENGHNSSSVSTP